MYNELPEARKNELKASFPIDWLKYLQEFGDFKSTPQGQEILEKRDIERKEKRLKKTKTKLKKLILGMEKPKKYPLPVNLFAKEQMAGVFGSKEKKEMMKIISIKWREMNLEQKTPYIKEHNIVC